MKEVENPIETLNKDFSVLTEENRKSVIEMAKFLALTQNTIIPGILNPEKTYLANEGMDVLASDAVPLTPRIKE